MPAPTQLEKSFDERLLALEAKVFKADGRENEDPNGPHDVTQVTRIRPPATDKTRKTTKSDKEVDVEKAGPRGGIGV